MGLNTQRKIPEVGEEEERSGNAQIGILVTVSTGCIQDVPDEFLRLYKLIIELFMT